MTFAELSPWLQVTALAMYDRWLFEQDLRLIWETQLHDEVGTGPMPGFPSMVYTLTSGVLVVRDAESNATFAMLKNTTDGPLLGALSTADMPDDRRANLDSMRARVETPLLMGPLLRELSELGIIECDDESYEITAAGEEMLKDTASVAQPDDAAQEAWIIAQLRERPGALLAVHERLSDEVIERLIHEALQRDYGYPTGVALTVASAREIDIEPAIILNLLAAVEELDDELVDVTVVHVAEYALQGGLAMDRAIHVLERFAGVPDRTLGIPEDASADEVDEVWQHVAGYSMGVAGIDEAARVMLEHAPAQCLPVVRRALRDPFDALTSMRLVAIGTRWAVREVASAIPDKQNPMVRQGMVGALVATGHKDAAQRAQALAEPNPLLDGDLELEGMGHAFEQMVVDGLSRFEEWASELRAGWADDFEPED